MIRKTRVLAAAGLVIGAASSVFGQDGVLLDKAELVTHVAGGFGGADASAIMATAAPGATLYGASCLNGTFRLADDFVVPAGETWLIDKLVFFTYQTQVNANPPVSTITALTIQILDAAPPGGAVVFGDQTTNRLTSSAWSGIYRTTDGDIGTASNRALIRVEAVLNPALELDAGTYWINYACGGTVASGPWSAPETRGPLHATPGPVPGNALQFQGAAVGWVATVNGTSGIQNSFPFIVEGSLGGGCYPDCSGDGLLTVGDFGCFQGKYVLGDLYADCSGDGLLTVGDFGCFQGKYVLGCP